MILKPDDFEIGMYITLLERLPYERDVEILASLLETTISTLKTYDNSYKGAVLQIIAINLPYIICKHHSRYSYDIYPISFDTRQIKFIPLTDEYVKAMGLFKEKP